MIGHRNHGKLVNVLVQVLVTVVREFTSKKWKDLNKSSVLQTKIRNLLGHYSQRRDYRGKNHSFYCTNLIRGKIKDVIKDYNQLFWRTAPPHTILASRLFSIDRSLAACTPANPTMCCSQSPKPQPYPNETNLNWTIVRSISLTVELKKAQMRNQTIRTS
jgi:hypothetical protein